MPSPKASPSRWASRRWLGTSCRSLARTVGTRQPHPTSVSRSVDCPSTSRFSGPTIYRNQKFAWLLVVFLSVRRRLDHLRPAVRLTDVSGVSCPRLPSKPPGRLVFLQLHQKNFKLALICVHGQSKSTSNAAWSLIASLRLPASWCAPHSYQTFCSRGCRLRLANAWSNL